MDTTIPMDFIIPVITGVFTILSIIIGWQSWKYLAYGIRRKVVEAIFRKIKLKYKDGNSKRSFDTLGALMVTTYGIKYVYKTSYFLAFLLLSVFILDPLVPLYPIWDGILFSIFFIAIFLYILPLLRRLTKIDKSLILSDKGTTKMEVRKYRKISSTHFFTSDLIDGWGFLSVFFVLIYILNSPSIRSYEALYSYLFIMGFIFSSFFFVSVIIASRPRRHESNYVDLEDRIYSDLCRDNSVVDIIVHTMGGSKEGKVIGVGDMLILRDAKNGGGMEIYIPWGNIIFFEII
jgi:hypothetical protein